MGEIKITRKLLDNYRKLKREIPVLSMELAEMEQGEAGLGNSTIFDYSTGFARPQSVVGFDQERYDRRKRTYEHKKEQAAAVERWIVNCEHDAIGNKAVAFVGTSGVQMGWLASQADMLAEDWIFAE